MSLSYPQFRFGAFSKDEREHVLVLWHLLGSMSSCVHNFERAVELVEFCNSNLADMGPSEHEDIYQTGIRMAAKRKFFDWRMLAFKVAAIEIYNHQEAKQSADNILENCPTVAALIDKKARGKACEIFGAAFPGYANVRLSVAHTNHLDTPEKFARQAEPSTGIVFGIIGGESSIKSFAQGKGKNRGGELPVDRNGLEQLTLATQSYFDCYLPAAKSIGA